MQRYAPEFNRWVRRELKRTGPSWRVDETYVRVAGRWTYRYRAVDSNGAPLDFYLSESQEAAAAKRGFGRVWAEAHPPRRRLINLDGNPSYPKTVKGRKPERRFIRRCRCRTGPCLNNLVKPDHRTIKRRINAQQGFRSLSRGPANDSRL